MASLVSVKDSPLPMAICPCKTQIASTNGDIHTRKGTASQTGEFHGLMVQAYVAGSCTFQWLGAGAFSEKRELQLPLASCLQVATPIDDLGRKNSHHE